VSTDTAVLSEPIRHKQGGDLISQALSPNTVRRLAFIRFLYGQGLEQAARPQPLAAAALLSFHDAVEMFLLLAAEHLGVSLDRNTTFDGYWTQIAAQASVQLPSRNAMRRMNNSRVNFKHHGSIPSATDLDQFRADVTTFFTDAAQTVFAADFYSLDMADLVTQQEALTWLQYAEAQVGRGDYTEALAQLSHAFDELLRDYAKRKRTSDNSTAYSFGPEHGLGGFAVHRIPKIDPAFDRHIEAITDAVGQMQRAMKVLAVGLDYRRYARFAMLAPRIDRYSDGCQDAHPRYRAFRWAPRNTSSAGSSLLRRPSIWPKWTSTLTSITCGRRTRQGSGRLGRQSRAPYRHLRPAGLLRRIRDKHRRKLAILAAMPCSSRSRRRILGIRASAFCCWHPALRLRRRVREDGKAASSRAFASQKDHTRSRVHALRSR
jgi:hypothetical protein